MLQSVLRAQGCALAAGLAEDICLFGGASRDRTDDLVVANDALSQLSYSPTAKNGGRYLQNYSSKVAPALKLSPSSLACWSLEPFFATTNE